MLEQKESSAEQKAAISAVSFDLGEGALNSRE